MDFYYISPRYTTLDFPDFPQGLTFEQKLEIFADREHSWRFEIAAETIRRNPRAGFAVLAILVSYFESYAKYRAGYCKDDQSGKYLRQGCQDVFNPKILKPSDESTTEEEVINMIELLSDWLWKHVRCGLYHSGLTDSPIHLSGDIKGPLEIVAVPDHGYIVNLNPEKLTTLLTWHFNTYLRSLRDPGEKLLRQNFEKRWDKDMAT